MLASQRRKKNNHTSNVNNKIQSLDINCHQDEELEIREVDSPYLNWGASNNYELTHKRDHIICVYGGKVRSISWSPNSSKD